MHKLTAFVFCVACSAPALGQTVLSGPGSTPTSATRSAATRLLRHPYVTYVTGELGSADVVFRVAFNPGIAYSGVVTVAAVEARSFGLDGIDFVPGHPNEVVVGAPTGVIAHYDVTTGATLADYVTDTDLIAAPPATPGTWPSTVVSTPVHVYYIENQFGFGATTSHRIVRKPFAGGAESVLYDGAAHGLKNFEGLEGVAGRLYFFVKDPALVDKRALVSIGLTGAGVWNGMPPTFAIHGLTEAPGPGTDGSDELDFDPSIGVLFGTNIINGEVIAYSVGAGSEMSSPGALHFIDGGQIAASSGNLGLLDGSIDGIRATGNGWLIVTGKAGVILAIDIAGVLSNGADDADVTPIVVMPGTHAFDDLTPIRRE